MGIPRKATPWAVALVMWCALLAGAAAEWKGEEEEKAGRDMFLLQKRTHVVKTEAGEMKVVRGYGGRFVEKPLHIGFITMEPRSLFIPQYLDSNLIIFIRRGSFSSPETSFLFNQTK